MIPNNLAKKPAIFDTHWDQRVKAKELLILPKGVTHRPDVVHKSKVLLIEPKGPLRSGDPDATAIKPHI